MNKIQYIDAYSILFHSGLSEQEIYSTFNISKNKQKNYPIIDSTIVFPIQQWKPVCEKNNLEILYEDETLLAVYKPPFLLVHSDGNQTKNLQDQVNAYLYQENWPHKAQAIHRLDVETSGILLFCKNPFFQSYYDSLFSQNHPIKEYLTIVKGIFPYKEIDIHKPIGRDRHNAKKMRVSQTGKEAQTHIKRIKFNKNVSLLNVQITTGKKHQIRVHLESLGYPVYNDPLYGKTYTNDGMLLEHYKINLILPNGTPLKLECRMDPRIQNILNKNG